MWQCHFVGGLNWTNQTDTNGNYWFISTYVACFFQLTDVACSDSRFICRLKKYYFWSYSDWSNLSQTIKIGQNLKKKTFFMVNNQKHIFYCNVMILQCKVYIYTKLNTIHKAVKIDLKSHWFHFEANIIIEIQQKETNKVLIILRSAYRNSPIFPYK